jgi:hypothetical protein
VRPGREWAIRASGGSLRRRRSTACMVHILSPPGWMTVIRLELVVMEVVVVGVTKCLEAVVSINVVEDKSEGLVQPESR